MSERKLNKARTKLILTQERVISPTDCSAMKDFIHEESIDNIEKAYTPEEIYSWPIALNDKEYEYFLNSDTNEVANYTKMIDWLKGKLNTNHEITLVGKYRYGFHAIVPSVDEKGELFCYFRRAVCTYDNIYVCVGRKSIRSLLSIDELRAIDDRKIHARALKIFEAMYLPTIEDTMKKLSKEITLKHEGSSGNGYYSAFIPRDLVYSIIRSCLGQSIDNMKDAGIATRMYQTNSGVEVYFDIDKFKKLINSNLEETI
jgi:hypothetical protein